MADTLYVLPITRFMRKRSIYDPDNSISRFETTAMRILRAGFAVSGISVEYKVHCQKRMLERNIFRKDVFDCILHGEIIEDYPLCADNTHEASFPSCLILWVDNQKDIAIHVVVGFNGKKMIIISAYHPDLEHWEADYKTRKEN